MTLNLKPFSARGHIWTPFGSPILEDCEPVWGGFPEVTPKLVSKVRLGRLPTLIM